MYCIIYIANQAVMKTWGLGGKLDGITTSDDGSYIVVAIENPHDEDNDHSDEEHDCHDEHCSND